MPELERLQWSVDVAAPASKVYQMLVGADSCTKWTSAFGDGLHFEGSWQQGQRIRFLPPEGHGVTSEIAENRPNDFLSTRHLGYIADDGDEDTSSIGRQRGSAPRTRRSSTHGRCRRRLPEVAQRCTRPAHRMSCGNFDATQLTSSARTTRAPECPCRRTEPRRHACP
jgi:uncharacterized protein YndB with AHSA1/START domain